MDIKDKRGVVLFLIPFAAAPVSIGLLVVDARLIAGLSPEPLTAEAGIELGIEVTIAEEEWATALRRAGIVLRHKRFAAKRRGDQRLDHGIALVASQADERLVAG